MKVVTDLSVSSARHRPVGPSTPWYTPWNSPISATIPGLVLDFATGVYGLGGALGPLESSVSLTRSTDGTRIDAAGAIEVLGPNVARIDHDPLTLAPIGLLLEGARTNLFTQSDAPLTQTISLAAVPHVISFYGGGSVTLSGTFTGVATGTGAFPSRTELLFTPSAGDLTVTLAGNVASPQLEEGDVASSYIPTTALATLRDDDITSVTLGPWFSTSQGTLVFEGSLDSALANDRIIEIDGGATTTRISVLWNSVLGLPQFQVWEAGALQAAIAPPGNSIVLGSPFRVAIAYAANDFAVSLNGSAVASDASGVMPTGLTTLRLGRSVWGAQGLMLAEGVTYYPTRLSNAELQALSA
ncbi:MAG: hypothetical protein COB40_08040 [Marinosulfonomonas sp.]|nr:MAG: hypothetical protein COB40_08040 [Marinosulfonomonas sp.]